MISLVLMTSAHVSAAEKKTQEVTATTDGDQTQPPHQTQPPLRRSTRITRQAETPAAKPKGPAAPRGRGRNRAPVPPAVAPAPTVVSAVTTHQAAQDAAMAIPEKQVEKDQQAAATATAPASAASTSTPADHSTASATEPEAAARADSSLADFNTALATPAAAPAQTAVAIQSSPANTPSTAAPAAAPDQKPATPTTATAAAALQPVVPPAAKPLTAEEEARQHRLDLQAYHKQRAAMRGKVTPPAPKAAAVSKPATAPAPAAVSTSEPAAPAQTAEAIQVSSVTSSTTASPEAAPTPQPAKPTTATAAAALQPVVTPTADPASTAASAVTTDQDDQIAQWIDEARALSREELAQQMVNAAQQDAIKMVRDLAANPQAKVAVSALLTQPENLRARLGKLPPANRKATIQSFFLIAATDTGINHLLDQALARKQALAVPAPATPSDDADDASFALARKFEEEDRKAAAVQTAQEEEDAALAHALAMRLAPAGASRPARTAATTSPATMDPSLIQQAAETIANTRPLQDQGEADVRETFATAAREAKDMVHQSRNNADVTLLELYVALYLFQNSAQTDELNHEERLHCLRYIIGALQAAQTTADRDIQELTELVETLLEVQTNVRENTAAADTFGAESRVEHSSKLQTIIDRFLRELGVEDQDAGAAVA